jgi:uncharacterized protein YecE (DUF72 family)
MVLLLGTSGWSYQQWVRGFYPNNRISKLAFYSHVFNTVEVDSSFYKLPSKSIVVGWARSTPKDFKFSFKIPKIITHDRHLRETEREMRTFIEIIEQVNKVGKLGCLLIQLPPNFTFEEKDHLESFLKTLPRHIHFAVEFRNKSWNRDEAWTLLKKYNIANTIVDSPNQFLSQAIITSTTHAFVRWHGRGNKIWYDYTYSSEEMNPWVKLLREIEEKVSFVYAYFNNHYRGDGPYNALQLLEMKGIATEVQRKIRTRMEQVKQRKTTKPLTDFIT